MIEQWDRYSAGCRSLAGTAKLNRMLHIVGRRADGYHLLQTVFQFLDRGEAAMV